MKGQMITLNIYFYFFFLKSLEFHENIKKCIHYYMVPLLVLKTFRNSEYTKAGSTSFWMRTIIYVKVMLLDIRKILCYGNEIWKELLTAHTRSMLVTHCGPKPFLLT